MPRTKPEQDRENPPVRQRTAGVGLDEPQIVDDGRSGAYVNQPMQQPPPPPSQTPDHRLGGSDRQRNQQDEGDKARGDVGSLHEVVDDGAEVKKLIEAQIRAKVDGRVKEREKTQHPP